MSWSCNKKKHEKASNIKRFKGSFFISINIQENEQKLLEKLKSPDLMIFLRRMIAFLTKNDDDFEDMMIGKNLAYSESEQILGKKSNDCDL